MQHLKYRPTLVRVSFRGGQGGAFTPLGFGLPPLGNFVLTVNQFKCFKSLIVTLCIINVNNSAHVLQAIMMYIVRDDSDFTIILTLHYIIF